MNERAASKYLEAKQQKRDLEIHYRKLEEIRSKSNAPKINHFRTHSLNHQNKMDMFVKTEMRRHNQMIKQTLQVIDAKVGKYNPRTIISQSFKPLASNQEILRRRKNQMIEKENLKISQRIQSAQSKFSVAEWIRSDEQKNSMIYQMHLNARRLNPFF